MTVRKRNIIRIEGTATALEPIIHGGDRTGGTVTEFRRELVRVGDYFERLPVISANSIAGILRDMAAFWSLDQIGIDTIKDLRAFDLLTSGGALTKIGTEKYVNLFEEKKLRELFPVISLMGGSVGNRIIGGKLDVDRWVPVCAEMKSALLEELWPLAERWHIEDLLQEVQFTRRDDKKNRDWQSRLAPETLDAWQRQKEAFDMNDDAPAPGAPTSMRYGFEALAQGTVLSVGFTLRNPTPVELGVFFGALSYFAERPKIGGRGARGFGRVKLELKQYQLRGFTRVEGPLAVESMDAALEHLQAHADEIKRAMEGL